MNSIDLITNSFDDKKVNIVKDYTDINVSNKVINIIQSYYNIVNERVWKDINK